MNNIALVVDSGCDVPKEYVEKYNIYVAPLIINYSDKSYFDYIDISSDEVCANFEKEIPKTSLPSPEIVTNIFKEIEEKGIKEVIAVTISSGLSGTYNLIKLVADNFENLDIRVIDTKCIGIGAGITAIRATEFIEQGLSLDEAEIKLNLLVNQTSLYYCIPTLEYLQKGGRIGLVSGTLGSLLSLCPVISCNQDGVYYTAKKAKGFDRALKAAIDLTVKAAGESLNYDIVVAACTNHEKAKEICETLKEKLPHCKNVFLGKVSPALIVHTGPGLIGMGIQIY